MSELPHQPADPAMPASPRPWRRIGPWRRSDQRVLAGVALIAAILIVGPLVWFASLMGADACLPLTEPLPWQCTADGQMVIAAIVPVSSLPGLVLATWGLAISHYSSPRSDRLLIAGYAVVVASWALSIWQSTP